MMPTDFSKRSHLSGSVRFHTLVVCSVLLMAAGCRPSASTSSSDDSSSEQAETETSSRCTTLVATLSDMVQPDRLEISADETTAAAILNEWRTACGNQLGQSDAKSSDREQDTLRQLIPADRMEAITRPEYDAWDALHVRDAMWYKQTVKFVIGKTRKDLDRAVAIFDYITHNIDLVEADASRVPMSPFWVGVFGQGTAADHAWLFANMLRQIRIDSVILKPDTSSEADENSGTDSSWLVGVLLPDGVYLFDMQRGFPIPADADAPQSPLVTRPATLAEVLADPSLLRNLDLDGQTVYPIKAKTLAHPKVEVIGDSRYWADRIRALQMSLTGERSVVIYDGLQDEATGPGLITRIADHPAAVWKQQDIGVWNYADLQLSAYAHLDKTQQKTLDRMREPFQAPVSGKIVQDSSGGLRAELERPSGRQLAIRITQLQGEYADALSQFLTIQLKAEFPPNVAIPPEVRRMHRRAAQDARFWTALCQFEQQSYRHAAESFVRYLKLYPDGSWINASHRLLAFSLVLNGDIEAGIIALENAPKTDPQRWGNELLVKRWRLIVDAKKKGQASATSGK